jgi:PEP-CTERM motif
MSRIPASLIVSALALTASALSASAATRVATTSGNWAEVIWNNGTGLPGSTTTDIALIRVNRTITLNTNVNQPAGISTLMLGDSSDTATLNIENGAALTVTGNLEGIRLGAYTNTTTTINMSGGTITTGSLLLNGGAGNTGSSATFNFSGGSFQTGATSVGYTTAGGTTGVLNVIGSTGTMSGTSLAVNLLGTVKFTLDTVGVNALSYSGAATFATGSIINIDGTSYTGSGGLITLIDAGSLVGNLANINTAITGFGAGYSTNLVWDSANGNLLLNVAAIPEPHTYALLGLGTLLIMAARRRAAKA